MNDLHCVLRTFSMSIGIYTFSTVYLLFDTTFFAHTYILLYRTSTNEIISVSQSEKDLIL